MRKVEVEVDEKKNFLERKWIFECLSVGTHFEDKSPSLTGPVFVTLREHLKQTVKLGWKFRSNSINIVKNPSYNLPRCYSSGFYEQHRNGGTRGRHDEATRGRHDEATRGRHDEATRLRASVRKLNLGSVGRIKLLLI